METVECSWQSAQYLIDNKLTDNLWTYYGWGGWLIWHFPAIKPSIDGRMPSWTNTQGYNEFMKYYHQEQRIENIATDARWNVVYTIVTKPIYDTMQDLVETKSWSLVYEDDIAAIFVRNKK